MELAFVSIAPGGLLNRHVHSFEEALYVLSGEMLYEIDGRAHRLLATDFAHHPIGVWHGTGNAADEPVRWLSVGSPQRLTPESGRNDTFFATNGFELAELAARAVRPPFGSAALNHVGHCEGLDHESPLDNAEADQAIHGGMTRYALVDKAFGADHLTMSIVDLEVGAVSQAHDHPFEEAGFILAGTLAADLDGDEFVLHPGDVVFSGVGSVHSFRNIGPDRARWIQAQSPQPPERHSSRWLAEWERLET